jgi:hypothetical protein
MSREDLAKQIKLVRFKIWWFENFALHPLHRAQKDEYLLRAASLRRQLNDLTKTLTDE